MHQDIALKLWSWERQHDALSDMSSTCDEYEEWADKQLNDVNSKINQLGLSITKAYLNLCFIPYSKTLDFLLKNIYESF